MQDNPLDPRLSRRREGRRLCLQYSALFSVMALVIFSWFYLQGKTLIWQVDGYSQHYPALIQYSRILREGFRNLFSGSGFQVSQWDYAIGEGGDVLGALHYYGVGDPLCLTCVLVPESCMPWFYSLLIVVRMYLSGLCFLWLCLQTGQKSRVGILAGCIVYALCFWSLGFGTRHPFFIDPLISMPLLIGGVERVLRGKRPTALILAVLLAVVTNIYFLYMVGILTALYTLLRLVFLYRRDWKQGLRELLVLALSAILGIAMGAMILLPTVYTVLTDVRPGVSCKPDLFYPIGHYLKLPMLFLYPRSSYWVNLAFSAPVTAALLMLFCRGKEYSFLRLLFVVCLVILLIPALGWALNGFSYASNRWIWAMALLAAYNLTAGWDRLMHLSKKEALFWAVSSGIYILLCVVLHPAPASIWLMYLLLAVFVLLLWPRKKPILLERRFGVQPLAFSLVLLGIVLMSVIQLAPFARKTIKEYLTYRKLEELEQDDESLAVRQAAESDGSPQFYRYSGRGLTSNAGYLSGQSGTATYWSLTNPAVSGFRADLGVAEAITSLQEGYDDRAPLLALSGVRYYALPKSGGRAPYGFVPTGVENATHVIYRSDNALPLGYVYDSWTDRDSFLELNFTQRQELLLRTAVLETEPEGLSRWEGSLDTTELPACVDVDNTDVDVIIRENGFQVTRSGAAVAYTILQPRAGETTCEITGLSFTPIYDYDLYFGGTDVDPLELYGPEQWEQLPQKLRKRYKEAARDNVPPSDYHWDTALTFGTAPDNGNTMLFFTPHNTCFNGRLDFCFNLCQSDEPVTSVRIVFAKPGYYSYSDLRFYVEPMEHLEPLLEARREATLEQVRMDTDRISGSITLSGTRLLCLNVPFSTGWTARVDGKPAELLKINGKNLGLLLDAGTHEIVLCYERPYGRLGWYVSLAGWLVFAGLVFLPFLLRKRKNRGIVK